MNPGVLISYPLKVETSRFPISDSKEKRQVLESGSVTKDEIFE